MKRKLLNVLAITLLAGAAFASITSMKTLPVDQQAAEPHPWGNDAWIQVAAEPHPWGNDLLTDPKPWVLNGLSEFAAEPHPWGNDDLAEPHPWASESVTQFAAEPHPWTIEKEDGVAPDIKLG